MPDVIEVLHIAIPKKLLYLGMAVSDNVVHCHTLRLQKFKASFQTLLLHIVTTSNLIALVMEQKETCIM